MPKATRQQTKKHNTRLVLKTIYNQDGISRAANIRQGVIDGQRRLEQQGQQYGGDRDFMKSRA